MSLGRFFTEISYAFTLGMFLGDCHGINPAMVRVSRVNMRKLSRFPKKKSRLRGKINPTRSVKTYRTSSYPLLPIASLLEKPSEDSPQSYSASNGNNSVDGNISGEKTIDQKAKNINQTASLGSGKGNPSGNLTNSAPNRQAVPPQLPPPPVPPVPTTASDKITGHNDSKMATLLEILSAMKYQVVGLKDSDPVVSEFNFFRFDCEKNFIAKTSESDAVWDELVARAELLNQKISDKNPKKSEMLPAVRDAMIVQDAYDRLAMKGLLKSTDKAKGPELEILKKMIKPITQEFADRVVGSIIAFGTGVSPRGDGYSEERVKSLPELGELLAAGPNKWNYYVFKTFPVINKNVFRKFRELEKSLPKADDEKKEAYLSFFSKVGEFWHELYDFEPTGLKSTDPLGSKKRIMNIIAGNEIDIDTMWKMKDICGGLFWSDFVGLILMAERYKVFLSVIDRESDRSHAYKEVCNMLDILTKMNKGTDDAAMLARYIFDKFYDEITSFDAAKNIIITTGVMFKFTDVELFQVNIFDDQARLFLKFIKKLVELSDDDPEKFGSFIDECKGLFGEVAQRVIVEVFVKNFCNLDHKAANKEIVNSFMVKILISGFGKKSRELLKNLALPSAKKKKKPEAQ
ncbi:MAG: hypothetical protein LBB20_03405 [Puniceicoccales bacterium]|jgi:hypothetical protein|nr:hypothetical protein [Puniceicoccales bacterium]